VGESFITALDLGTKDVNIAVAGDSTGNDSTEWPVLLMQKFATRYPSLKVVSKLWNTTNLNYDAPVVHQAGVTVSGTVFRDTFTRVAADVYGSTPDVGNAWGRDGSNANGDWSINGSAAVRTADATGGMIIAESGSAGDQKVTVVGTLSTTGTGSNRSVRFYLFKDLSNGIFVQIAIDSAGATAWTMFKFINAVNTQIASGPVPVTSNTADVPFTLELSVAGTAVTAKIGANIITGNFASGELSSGLWSAGITGGGHLVNDTLDSVTIDIITPTPPQTLTLYNGSVAGSILSYQLSQLPAIYPVPIDSLIVNSGHNYGNYDEKAYANAIDAFLQAFKPLQPSASILISSQNPQKPPAAGRYAHLQRLSSLRKYASRNGYGYIPVIEAFTALPDGGASLVLSDGVHPTPGPTNTGSSLWRDVAYKYFTDLSLRPVP